MKRADEPNPALGWRAIRVGLDRPAMMRMQVQALIRGAKGRPLPIMFPFVAEAAEFEAGRELVLREMAREQAARPHRAARAQGRGDARDPEPRLRAGPLLRARPTSSRSAATTSSSSSSPPTARTSWCAAATTCWRPSFLDLPRADRRALRRARHAALVLRRGRRPPARGAGARRHRLPQPIDAPGLDRPGQGAAAPGRPRRGPRRRSKRPARAGAAERAPGASRPGSRPRRGALNRAPGTPR